MYLLIVDHSADQIQRVLAQLDDWRVGSHFAKGPAISERRTTGVDGDQHINVKNSILWWHEKLTAGAWQTD
jgi:hypothetical protein